MPKPRSFLTGASLAFFNLVGAFPAPHQLESNHFVTTTTVANGSVSHGVTFQTATAFPAHAALRPRDNTFEKRDQVYSSSQTVNDYNAPFGVTGTNTTVTAGVLYWINGGSTHNFFGNIDNSGNIVVSQTYYLASHPLTGGQTSDYVGHTATNGNLINRASGSIQLNDIGSASAPTYDWYLRTVLNNGAIQFCGRGDTGGSTYQMYSDIDSTNNGLISFEQTTDNLGASFNWRNAVLTAGTSTGYNLYNNGAFRIINVNFQNVQNIYGTGCWEIGKGGILYLQDGTGVYQNPTKGPSLPGQSISFQDKSAVLHMDTAVYSYNSNFGAQIYGFTSGNAIEFYEIISSFGYSAATGILTVTMTSKNSVNINLGLGYTPSLFSNAKNPQHYNTGGYNAIFYSGTAPSQTLPSQCSISAAVCANLASSPPAASATGYVTSTSTGSYGGTLTTTTVAPSGTNSGTVIVITPSAAVYVTSTSTAPYGAGLTTTTVAPSGTAPGTVIVVSPTPATYVTSTSTAPFGGSLTTTTVSPSGYAPGTVIVITPSAAVYVTSVSTATYGAGLTTTTVAPSGTAPGTIIIISATPATFVTSTSIGVYGEAISTATVAPSGYAPGTVIVYSPTPATYVTSTSTGAFGASPTITTVAPSGFNPGTVIVVSPIGAVYATSTSTAAYTAVLTTTTVAPSGTIPGTIIVISPSSASFVTSLSTGAFGGALTTTTVAPSGTVPGTIIVISPSASPVYNTITSTEPANGVLTTTTVAPSGTVPGTIIVITPSACPAQPDLGTYCK